MNNRYSGFTLIELLIVIAIIAILALIAVPNFLEAQTRSKVTRVIADLRSIQTAVESYGMQYGAYPMNDGKYNVLPIELTTPIAFITSASLEDPFSDGIESQAGADPSDFNIARFYTYTKIVTPQEASVMSSLGRPVPVEAIDHFTQNPNAFRKYGWYRLVSKGPDKTYTHNGYPPPLYGIDLLYDATNGTVSPGNIVRTQKDPEGKIHL